MNCVDIDLQLQGYFDGELESSQMFLVQRHLLQCASCRRAFQNLKMEMRDLLVDIAEPRLSLENIKTRVQERIQRIQPKHPLPVPALFLSASMLIAVGLPFLFFKGQGPFDSSLPPLQGVQTEPAAFERNEAADAELPSCRFELNVFLPNRREIRTEEIRLLPDSETMNNGVAKIVRLSNRENRFSIENLPPGKYRLQIRSECIPIVVEPGENLPRRVYLSE